MTRTRFFAVMLGVAVTLASTCHLQAQQRNASKSNRLLPAREFLFSSTGPQPPDKLRADIFRLIDDSRAGKIAPHQQQLPAGRVNNLSRTAKIAIIAGVAVAVLAIVVVHGVKNLHCESRCVL